MDSNDKDSDKDELALASKDFDKLVLSQTKSGYREGASQGHQQGLQQSFEQGYRNGIRAGVRLGQLLGSLNALRVYYIKQDHDTTALDELITEVERLRNTTCTPSEPDPSDKDHSTTDQPTLQDILLNGTSDSTSPINVLQSRYQSLLNSTI